MKDTDEANEMKSHPTEKSDTKPVQSMAETQGIIHDHELNTRDVSAGPDNARDVDGPETLFDYEVEAEAGGEASPETLKVGSQPHNQDRNLAETIGKYRIATELGRGGMGVVYKGWDPIIKRNVAIKVMLVPESEHTDYGSRFLREAEAIGQLNHPAIVTIHDAGFHQQKPYLVMEYLDGKDLSRMRADNELPEIDVLLDICLAISAALHYSHQHGIVHRDIKPANIFVTKDGTAKLMDFGIAKVENSHLTKTGMLVGTLQYMSPEQIDGKNVDSRTDIYSLGVVMYELFSQRLPFSGETLSELIKNTLLSDPLPFEPVIPDLPETLDQVIMKCLCKNREERYASMSLLMHDLSRVRELVKDRQATHQVTRPRSGQSTTGAESVTGQKRPGSWRLKCVLGIIVALAISGSLYWYTGHGSREREARPMVTGMVEETDVAVSLPGTLSAGAASSEISDKWQLTLQHDTIEEYNRFIASYADNEAAASFVATARERLKEKQQLNTARDEDVAEKTRIERQWLGASTRNTVPAYAEFIREFSDNHRAHKELELAREAISSLQATRLNVIKEAITSRKHMVFIKGRSFQMGDLFHTGDADETVHQVSLGNFEMAQFEVTRLEYEAFCRATSRAFPADDGFTGELKPVINVSWSDSLQFCNWLSRESGLTPCYRFDSEQNMAGDISGAMVRCDFTANGYRLPTEAEWEFAARQGGAQVQFGTGLDKADRMTVNYNNRKSTPGNQPGPSPVGQLPANSSGLFDVSGNVWEWCWDWYGPYPATPVDNPHGPDSGDKKVIRGGSWFNTDTSFIRASNRSAVVPETLGHDIGFRIVRTVP